MRRCGLNGSDGQHWQGSLSDRILIAENRCAACQIARTHLHRCRTFVPAQMCTRRSRPSTLNPLMIKIGPHIFLNRVPFDGARRGPWACTGGGSRGPTRHVCSICSVVRTRDRVAGAGYACNARPDLHTVCRSFHKISSALSAKVRGGSRSAKILIQSNVRAAIE